MIKQYSLKADGDTRVAPNFQVREFACKDGADLILIDDALVMLLQAIRSHFGKPVIISSAFRTVAHNAAVGGVSNSQHLSGMAADISVPGILVPDLAAYAETLMLNGGIGVYGWGIHIDTRAVKSRWRG